MCAGAQWCCLPPGPWRLTRTIATTKESFTCSRSSTEPVPIMSPRRPKIMRRRRRQQHMMCWIVSSLALQSSVIIQPHLLRGAAHAFQPERSSTLTKLNRIDIFADTSPRSQTALHSQFNPNNNPQQQPSNPQAAAEAEALANLEQTRAALQRALAELGQIHQYQMAGRDASTVGEDGRSTAGREGSASSQAGQQVPSAEAERRQQEQQIENSRISVPQP